MSHLTRVRTTLRDPKLLATALRAAGYTGVQVHDKPQKLTSPYGWSAQAEVVVPAGSSPRVRHDFGFARRPDGTYELVKDAMDRYDNAWLANLNQQYGYAATVQYAENNGYDLVEDEVEQDGTRRITLRRTS
jgi:hypothetical protein